jgi:hypothetical protein
MPKYVIERDLPCAGNLSDADIHAVAEKSNAVLKELGPQIQWVESFMTQDNLLRLRFTE